jgi:hypothetical protein
VRLNLSSWFRYSGPLQRNQLSDVQMMPNMSGSRSKEADGAVAGAQEPTGGEPATLSGKEDIPLNGQEGPTQSRGASSCGVEDKPSTAAGTSGGGHTPDGSGSVDDAELDAFWVDGTMLKEEEAARVAREKAAKPKSGAELTKDRLQKLDALLDQAQMYSQFLVEQVCSVQGQLDAVRAHLQC